MEHAICNTPSITAVNLQIYSKLITADILGLVLTSHYNVSVVAAKYNFNFQCQAQSVYSRDTEFPQQFSTSFIAALFKPLGYFTKCPGEVKEKSIPQA